MPKPRLMALVLHSCLYVAIQAAPTAAAEKMAIDLTVSGALQAPTRASHEPGIAHACTAAADPWAGSGEQLDERPPPYPFYRVIFGQRGAGAELDRPGPSLTLTLSDYAPGETQHEDPANDSIDVVLQGREFVGHSGLEDPDYRLSLTYLPDGRGGSFSARHLRGPDDALIDIDGSWQCPRPQAEMNEVWVAPRPLFRGAQPAHAPLDQLRLFNTGKGCPRRHSCANWGVIEEATGSSYTARVDFAHIKLARSLRRKADRGKVDLLVDAEVRHGAPGAVLVVVKSLVGVSAHGG